MYVTDPDPWIVHARRTKSKLSNEILSLVGLYTHVVANLTWWWSIQFKGVNHCQ